MGQSFRLEREGSGTLLPSFFGMQEAAASMAEAGIVVKKFPRSHPIMMNAVGMTVGAIMLSVASLLSGEAWTIPALASTWLAFGYIVVFVTVIAFFLYLFVLGRWTASGTSYGFVLIPLITVVLATTLASKTKVVWLFSFP